MAPLPPRTTMSSAAGFLAFRTPLLPLSAIERWSEGLTPGANASALGAARTRHALVRRLLDIYSQPEIREALFLASNSAYAGLHSIEHWSEAPDRLIQTLARYLLRMAARATPFGLFAGCSVATIGSATRLELPSRHAYRRYTRLDNDQLFNLSERLAREAKIRAHLQYVPNSSLYPLNGSWRYVEATYSGTARQFRLVRIERDNAVDAAIDASRDGASLAAVVRAVLASTTADEVSGDEAEAFVDELVDAQVLVSALSPVVTGAEPLDDLISQLSCLTVAEDVVVVLQKLKQDLKSIDSLPLGSATEAYRAAAASLESVNIRADVSRLFQVDLVKPASSSTVSKVVTDELARVVDLLHTVSAPPFDSFKRFKDDFVARYERRLVPLVEVLDDENGIGFERSAASGDDAPLLAGLAFPSSADGAAAPWSPRDTYLLSRLLRHLSASRGPLELSPGDITGLSRGNTAPLPDAFSVVACLAQRKDDPEDFTVHFRGAHGPSGARMLGRFCHADPELLERVRAHVDAEASRDPHAVYAEIVHLPTGRLGNVVARPLLRDFEIEYLGRSGLPRSSRIRVADLLVTVRDDRVILWSASLDRQIVPRMSTAHNFGRGHGLYKFLCALQGQHLSHSLSWSWRPFHELPFLPRVTAGRVIVARAQWRLDQAEIDRLTGALPDERMAVAQSWRASHQMPRHVAVVDDEQELVLDLDNVVCVDVMAGLAAGRQHLTLCEMVPELDSHAANGPEGQFLTEMVIPFTREGPPRARAPLTLRASSGTVSRPRAPGSSCQYLKLYCGHATLDNVLTEAVRPLISSDAVRAELDSWFYIRYADPGWHLRLRLFTKNDAFSATVMSTALTSFSRLVEEGVAWRLQVDTYEPEIERYGGAVAIGACEEAFSVDSEACLTLIEMLTDEERLASRWLVCLGSWHALLDDFGFDLPTKLAIAQGGLASFTRQFKADKLLARNIGDRFRIERATVEAFLNSDTRGDATLDAVTGVVRGRSEKMRPLAGSLRDVLMAPGATTSVNDVASSLLHMNANRLLRSNHAQHELVMYDFLARVYESQLARARGRGRR